MFSAQAPLDASIGSAGAFDHGLLPIACFISWLRVQLVAIRSTLDVYFVGFLGGIFTAKDAKIFRR